MNVAGAAILAWCILVKIDAGRKNIRSKMHVQFCQAMDREKRHILSAVVQAKGLMPLLMKPRNNQQWTTQDKRELRLHLKHLSRVSAYITLLVMPGGFAMLPVIAWWLDRRRSRRGAPQAQEQVTHAGRTHPSGEAVTPVVPESTRLS